jgi:hypothetical protein
MDRSSITWGSGSLVAIERESRTLMDIFEIFVHVDRVTALLGRPPDLEEAFTVSWGHIRLEEALRLADGEDADLRSEVIDGVRRVFARERPAMFTLFYRDPWRGQ